MRATGIVVRHHPSLPPVLDGVSLDLARGERVAVIGSNGSGKSTLARALAGLVRLDAGSVAGSGSAWPRVGLVLQDPAAQLMAQTVADELALGAQAAGRSPREVAARVEASLVEHDLEQLWARAPEGLSGGQQQRVAVAAVLACDVDVLILDEPTALLDERARRRVRAAIDAASGDRAIAWITQEPDEVAACDRVVVLDAGVVAWSGTVAAYLADPGIAGTFGLELPGPARIAHALDSRGAWPSGSSIPRTRDEFLATFAGGGSDG